MKKIKLLALFAVLGLSCLMPFAVSAADSTVGAIESNLQAAAETGAGFASPVDPRVQAAIYIRYALQVVGILFVCLMVYAGFLWMTAGGNEDNIDKAKKLIMAAVIGLVIVLTSYSITYFVAKLVTGDDDNFSSNDATIFK
ncbi:MAG: hypothetical protein WC457_04690 [Patescibacteria group bacterium]